MARRTLWSHTSTMDGKYKNCFAYYSSMLYFYCAVTDFNTSKLNTNTVIKAIKAIMAERKKSRKIDSKDDEISELKEKVIKLEEKIAELTKTVEEHYKYLNERIRKEAGDAYKEAKYQADRVKYGWSSD